MANTSFQKLIDSEIPVLLDFYADWCGPCKAQAPILKELKSELGDAVRIVKIDSDKNQEISAKLSVKSIPTLMLYKNGKQLWRGNGVHSQVQLRELIQSHM